MDKPVIVFFKIYSGAGRQAVDPGIGPVETTDRISLTNLESLNH